MSPSTPFGISDFSLWSGIDWLRSACLGMTLIDIETIPPAQEHALTPREVARATRMGSRRRRDFIAARVALKKLARQVGIVKENTPDREIETVGSDDVRPCIGESEIHCSASHRGRLVVAVANTHPVGVDLELVSEQATRVWSLFLSPQEQKLVLQSGLNPARTAARAWTIKEAAAKAFGLHLFQAIHEVHVIRVGEKEGMMRYQEKTYPARHAEGNGYVVTLITCDDL